MFKPYVAPLVGAWIEIEVCPTHQQKLPVAPLVGAWIEIGSLSLTGIHTGVAPLVGAWIEIFRTFHFCQLAFGRSPRGSVD